MSVNASEVEMKKKELVKKTRQELMEIAKQKGLVGRSKMKKEELVSSISNLLKAKPAAKKKQEKARVTTMKKEKAAAAPTPAGKAEAWQEKVEDTKFYLGAEEKGFVTEEELPVEYGDNKVVLMVRDPHWAYVYWEINSGKIAEAKRKLSSAFDESRLILRIYDITGIDFDGKNAHSFFDLDIPNVLGNWYVPLGRPNRTFCIDIGYKETGGGLLVLSRSNKVTSPRDTFSEVLDEEWMSTEDDYQRIYARPGALGAAGTSAELVEILKRRIEREISSGGVRGLNPKETSRKH